MWTIVLVLYLLSGLGSAIFYLIDMGGESSWAVFFIALLAPPIFWLLRTIIKGIGIGIM